MFHKVKNNFVKIPQPILFGTIALLAVFATTFIIYFFYRDTYVKNELTKLHVLERQLALSQTQIKDLKARDEYKINEDLKKEIESINATYKKAVEAYEKIDDLDEQNGKVGKFKITYAAILSQLAERNYSSADAALTALNDDIAKESNKVAATVTNPSGAQVSVANLPTSNTPPGAGYSRQNVSALDSTYTVDIVAADLSSTRVIVDTASDGDCGNDCPVLSLADYVSRNGAFAGINGSYFCPASYPSCAGKTNTFDTLLMNKNKVYFNSDNNVYSNVPAVIFMSGGIRFVGASSEWGRDTGVDGVLANQPLLLSGGNVVFGGDGDPKKGSKGIRSFVGSKGNTVYIGVVRNVTVAEMAHVLKAMGLENALNLDSGGSTALWSGGYKAGPGRNIPNAILFVPR